MLSNILQTPPINCDQGCSQRPGYKVDVQEIVIRFRARESQSIQVDYGAYPATHYMRPGNNAAEECS